MSATEKPPVEINEDEESDDEEIKEAKEITTDVAAPKRAKAPPAADVDAPPETFAAPVGIIIPPPDIRLIIDRTADFVRRVGTAFESQIMERNGRSRKFHFLLADNPYHGYYRHRLLHGDKPIEGALDAQLAAAQPVKQEVVVEKKPEPAKKKKPTLNDRLLQVMKDAKTPREVLTQAPPPDKYMVKAPDQFLPVDIDIIKLTALFVARNGRQFLAGLTARESKNMQFAFLSPTHVLFPYFQQLTEAYTSVIIAPKELLRKLREGVQDPTIFRQEALARAAWERVQRAKEKSSEDDDRVSSVQIDWHNFVVVEKIEFAPEEDDYLPAPKDTIDEINRMLSAQELSDATAALALEEAAQQAVTTEQDMEMDVEMEEEPAPEPAPKPRRGITSIEDVFAEQRYDEAEPVVPDEELESYQRAGRPTQFLTCPICKEDVAADDLSEHMRIELLDPRWKEQKQAMFDKMRESAFAPSDDIGRALAHFAKKRSDVFASSDEKEKAKEEEIRRIFEQHLKEEAEAARAEREKKLLPPAPAAPPPKPPARPAPSTLSISRPAQPPVSMPPAFSAPPVPPPRPPARPPAPGHPHMPPAAPAPPPAAPPAAPPVSLPPMFAQPPRPPMPAPHGMPPHGMPPGPYPGMGMPPQPMGFPPRPPHMHGMPHMPGMMPPHMAPPHGGPQPPQKRQKTGAEVPEEEFAARHPGPVTVRVSVPNEPNNREWNFDGRTVDVTVNVRDTVGQLKEKLSGVFGGMPDKKMKINILGGAFLNQDAYTLAHYNVGPGVTLQLAERTRGGRR